MSTFRRKYRELSPLEVEIVEDIKRCAEVLESQFVYVDDARYAALARTALEEAVMWAVKGVTG